MEKKNQLDDKLQFYQELLVQMGKRVVEAVSMATEAFVNEDSALAEKVQGDDYFIDQLSSLVEGDGVRILISEAPYGQYMRMVIAGMKIVTSLERMGDHACHLASLAVMPLSPKRHPEIAEMIASMGAEAQKMSKAVLDALSRFDADEARETAKLDDEMDALKAKVDAMILAIDASELKERENLFDYFFVAKELERLGDHVARICAWIVYLREGVKPDLN